MKVKEKYSKDFKNEDVLKENDRYVVFEYDYTTDTPKIYRLKDNKTEEIIFEFQVPNPFDSKDFEKDLCLKYGHGIRGFILSLFDKIAKGEEINPPYPPTFSPDVYFRNEKKGFSIFSIEDTEYKLGFCKKEEYIDLFAEYFGFKTFMIV